MMDKIKEIIAQYTEIDLNKISEDTQLKTDLGLNSLAMMNIVVELEDAFGVEIDESTAMEFVTVGDVLAYLNKNGVH